MPQDKAQESLLCKACPACPCPPRDNVEDLKPDDGLVAHCRQLLSTASPTIATDGSEKNGCVALGIATSSDYDYHVFVT